MIAVCEGFTPSGSCAPLFIVTTPLIPLSGEWPVIGGRPPTWSVSDIQFTAMIAVHLTLRQGMARRQATQRAAH